MLKEVNHSNRADAVVEQILSLIKAGTLGPGDKLPSEPDLVKMLKVGRSSVREAKQILSARKVIAMRPGHGSFIRKIQSDEIMDGDVLHILLADKTLRDLQEAREVLEVDVVGHAAERADPDQLAAIAATLEAMKEAGTDRHKVFDSGLAFHRALIDASKNQVVITIYRTIQRLLEQYQRPIYTKLSDPRRELEEHTAIYEALQDRNGELARILMRSHLAGVRALTVGS